MTGSLQRGTALPETALVIGLSLMLMLGIVQTTVIGFSQVSTDGAAFVAAHTMATSSTANATNVVATAFPHLNADKVVASAQGASLEQTIVSKAVGGFVLLPGAASKYALSGSDVEFAPSGASGTPQAFAFGAVAVLKNYCPTNGACSLPANRSIYLAQFVDTQANGNGWNGPFAEWRCHQQFFASVNFPATRPTGGLKGSIYDPDSPKGVENPIYSWDTGSHTCH